ncbi:metallophosphoesterase 1 [Patella vulgata]|uniref:metallophosphoesterase 1 n=1 Tax=Patella vulgata TaxID=6465 RepID=UPI0021802FA6|nr:metallophosphoesterase 1 [Patella vulgata]XP_050398256.1 metallophosphoesterase 1 [Patella vulgata]
MMAWPCKLSVVMCHYIRGNRIIRFLVLAFSLVFYCEYIHYYVVLLQCTWPQAGTYSFDGTPLGLENKPLKAMILADTHLLGFKQGHWFDKLRREWQMQRAFQTAMMLHSPDIVFILGDLLDEGKWCNDSEFEYHVKRFHKMFSSPYKTDVQVLVGNHDIGFHYMMTHHKHKRFQKGFNSPSVKIIRKKKNIFILLNSMSFEGDECNLCKEAMGELMEVKRQLECSQKILADEANPNYCKKYKHLPYVRPIILQHFPMYRQSDEECTTEDAAPFKDKSIPFKPKYDCLSEDATNLLFDWFNPRLVVSAHTHHGCYKVHQNNIPEWTVASFSWRNKNNPTFLLTTISPTDYAVNQCFMPQETTVITIYIFGFVFIILSFLIQKKVSKCSSEKNR